MANITVRKGNGGQELQTRSAWNPFRTMRELVRWAPLVEMGPLPALPTFEESAAFAPAFEVKENHEGYIFKADLPGIKEQDLEISATGNRLDVRGKREAEKEQKGDTFFVYECSYGSFARSVTLPEGADLEHIKAELKDGVLTIIVARKAASQPKKIAIQTAAPSKP